MVNRKNTKTRKICSVSSVKSAEIRAGEQLSWLGCKLENGRGKKSLASI